jgi:predicted permease
MIDGDTALSAIYAVINMLISVLAGYMLSKLGILTITTRKVLSDVNYYLLCPIYCIYFIMQAIDKDRLSDVGIILWSAIPSVIITFIVMLVVSVVFRLDTRMVFSYSFVHVYANAVIM